MKVIYTRKGRKKGRITPAIERERGIREKKGEEKKKKSARGGDSSAKACEEFPGELEAEGRAERGVELQTPE